MRRALLVLLALAVLAPPSASAASFHVVDPRVTPRTAYLDGPAAAIAFHLRAPGPVDLRVDVTRRTTGGVWRRFLVHQATPGVRRRLHLRWNGRAVTGRDAPEGAYDVTVTPRGGTPHRIGSLRLHAHRYPIAGPHHDRGGIGAFGQPRSGGRTHEGFDVWAACGVPLVAARGGRVITSSYDDVLYGWHVIIRNFREHRDYWYAHLRHRPLVRRGQDVRTGRRLGDVGATGNARSVGCHLHFEIHRRGTPIDPAPSLHAWDAWS